MFQVFLSGAFHFIFSGILASQAYFSGKMLGIGKLKPGARYFYCLLSILSNFISLSMVLLVIYLDRHILNLTIVFIPIGCLLAFLLAWVVGEGVVQHRKDTLEELESHTSYLEEKNSLVDDLATLINNKECSDVT